MPNRAYTQITAVLTEDINMHGALGLPNGTFTPYSPGTKTNVVFFTKGFPTEHVWIYDARTNVPRVTKKDRPLTPEHFAEFERCCGEQPNGDAKRKPSDSLEDRWRQFHISAVEQRDFKIDSLKWLKDQSLDDADDLPPPEELATEAISELEAAVEELNAIIALLENGGAARTSKSSIRYSPYAAVPCPNLLAHCLLDEKPPAVFAAHGFTRADAHVPGRYLPRHAAAVDHRRRRRGPCAYSLSIRPPAQRR